MFSNVCCYSSLAFALRFVEASIIGFVVAASISMTMPPTKQTMSIPFICP